MESTQKIIYYDYVNLCRYHRLVERKIRLDLDNSVIINVKVFDDMMHTAN